MEAACLLYTLYPFFRLTLSDNAVVRDGRWGALIAGKHVHIAELSDRIQKDVFGD